jgi:predicted RNA methylase
MPTRNGYAALTRKRAEEPKGKRRRLDDYETPEDVTARLFKHVKFRGPFFEPCAGSGRMVRAIKAAVQGAKVIAADIKTGQNFLERTKPFAGDIITNPPYRDGLADAMVNHALKIADGRVAMLMEAKFAFGAKRADALYMSNPPDFEIIIPDRIYFFEGSGKQIPSQFFNHVWLVWPPRKVRDGRANVGTRKIWAPAGFDFG